MITREFQLQLELQQTREEKVAMQPSLARWGQAFWLANTLAITSTGNKTKLLILVCNDLAPPGNYYPWEGRGGWMEEEEKL
jgi:hypothetical protein